MLMSFQIVPFKKKLEKSHCHKQSKRCGTIFIYSRNTFNNSFPVCFISDIVYGVYQVQKCILGYVHQLSLQDAQSPAGMRCPPHLPGAQSWLPSHPDGNGALLI